MLRLVVSLMGAAWCALAAAPAPAPTPSPDAEAERIFARTRAVWAARGDVPYVRYGALVRYEHQGRVFDSWWDAYFRTSDGALALQRLVDPEEERHRLGGVPFSIFGYKFFDTNPDAEPIRLDEPRIEPVSSFGVLTRLAAAPQPSEPPFAPSPDAALREIGRVVSAEREYQVELAGIETVRGVQAYHLRLRPLHDPKESRLRDVWVEVATGQTVALNVQGLLNGKPYDGVQWSVGYVPVAGRYYVQQIVAAAPLVFGFDVTIPRLEYDFVDFRFPSTIPQYTFERLL